jgi:hypothetical protein
MLAIFHNSTFKIKLKQFTHIQHEHTNRPPTVPISAYRDTRTVLTDNELLMMDYCMIQTILLEVLILTKNTTIPVITRSDEAEALLVVYTKFLPKFKVSSHETAQI